MGLTDLRRQFILEKENSDFKPPLSCGHTHSWERLRESTLRKNPEPESLRQSEAVYSNVLATPATALEPCASALAFPMDHNQQRGEVGGGGGGRRVEGEGGLLHG